MFKTPCRYMVRPSHCAIRLKNSMHDIFTFWNRKEAMAMRNRMIKKTGELWVVFEVPVGANPRQPDLTL